MGLKEKISDDMKTAMKSGAKTELETLRTVRALIIEFEKQGSGAVLDEAAEIAMLTSAAKKRKESIDLYEQGNRPELAEQERQELSIIQRYLPEQMSEEEIRNIVQRIAVDVGAAGAKDFGKVMPKAMAEMKGRADGKVVQQIVKEILGA